MRRRYFRLVPERTLLKGYRFRREALSGGDTALSSGDRIETVVTIEAKNNYPYLVFEDLKPAGLETVQIRSGEPLYARQLKAEAARKKFLLEEEEQIDALVRPSQRANYTGRSRPVHQELRDRKVAFFLSQLPAGYWEIRYLLRAETPGRFHALPITAQAMYVPEIHANGKEIQIRVADGN